MEVDEKQDLFLSTSLSNYILKLKIKTKIKYQVLIKKLNSGLKIELKKPIFKMVFHQEVLFIWKTQFFDENPCKCPKKSGKLFKFFKK